MKTLGLRHVALNVKDAQASKAFYLRVLKMELEWEPDPKNVYLTSMGGGQDNLALHEAAFVEGNPESPEVGRLDHIGFMLPTLESVDEWYEWVKSQGAKILREVKLHRDGAKSFYMEDIDGTVIQMIFHPPIAKPASR